MSQTYFTGNSRYSFSKRGSCLLQQVVTGASFSHTTKPLIFLMAVSKVVMLTEISYVFVQYLCI
jgi:hypothetical protein